MTDDRLVVDVPEPEEKRAPELDGPSIRGIAWVFLGVTIVGIVSGFFVPHPFGWVSVAIGGVGAGAAINTVHTK